MAKFSKKQPASGSCQPSATRRPVKDTREYAQFFKALGDGTRLEMLGMIAATADELCVCEIETQFDLSQPTISHHLRLLREAGLIDGERRGTWVYYRVNTKILKRLPAFAKLLTG